LEGDADPQDFAYLSGLETIWRSVAGTASA
jgi:hypothetical protein